MSSPKHIAIIMDGNGRWAQAKGYPRYYGHIRGSRNVKRILKAAANLDVKFLTLYAFSTENWGRPEEEVGVLMKLLGKFLRRERDELNREGVRVETIGDASRLPKFVQDELAFTKESTKHNSRIVLTLALSYGGRQEVTQAVRALAKEVAEGKLLPEQITEASIQKHLYAPNHPDPELIIRTSGEFRVSNFLLWECAYSEFFITPKSWPDFTPADLQQAVENFMSRERRFGKTTAQVKATNVEAH